MITITPEDIEHIQHDGDTQTTTITITEQAQQKNKLRLRKHTIPYEQHTKYKLPTLQQLATTTR